MELYECGGFLQFSGDGYLGVKVMWKGYLYYICNVCSPCNAALKYVLWNRLVNLKDRLGDGEWVVGGDFNAVRCRGRGRVGLL